MQKSQKHAFMSLRIIGEKAQRLLAKAREIRQKNRRNGDAHTDESRSETEVIVHLSIRGVVQATFAVLAITVGALLFYLLRHKIVLLFLAAFIAAVIDPGVQALRRAGIPRGIGILIHYFVAIFLFLFLLISLIPVIADQLQQIAIFTNIQLNEFLATPTIQLPLLTTEVNQRLTLFAQSALQNLSLHQLTLNLQQLGQNLSTAAQSSLLFAAHIAGSVLNFFVTLIIVLVLAFFIQIEKEKIIAWSRGFLPWQLRTYVDDKSEVIHWKLAEWARGQLFLCVSVGFLVFLALIILRMPYALTLAILATFTEFIPVIGLFIAAIPAVLIAITQQGLLWGIVLAIIFYIIQWCEHNLLVPLIMRRTVDLSPVAVVLAMLIGISFPGIINPILGIMLSIPLATIFALFLEDWRDFHARHAKKRVI